MSRAPMSSVLCIDEEGVWLTSGRVLKPKHPGMIEIFETLPATTPLRAFVLHDDYIEKRSVVGWVVTHYVSKGKIDFSSTMPIIAHSYGSLALVYELPCGGWYAPWGAVGDDVLSTQELVRKISDRFTDPQDLKSFLDFVEGKQ